MKSFAPFAQSATVVGGPACVCVDAGVADAPGGADEGVAAGGGDVDAGGALD